MVKEREDYRKTRCAICWHALRPKSPLLHGMKCIRFEIKNKLKFLLPPQDFRTLYDENIFKNPRICNMCFVTVKKIPKTISKLQGLVGKKINTKLYKPHRSEWNECIPNSHKSTKTNGINLPQERMQLSLLSSEVSATSVQAQTKFDIVAEERSQASKNNSPESLNEIEYESDNDASYADLQESDNQQDGDELNQNKNVSKSSVASLDHCNTRDNTSIGEDTGMLNKSDVLVKKLNMQSEDLISTPSFLLLEKNMANNIFKSEEGEKESTDMTSPSKIKRSSITSYTKVGKKEHWLRRPRQYKEVHLKSQKRNKINNKPKTKTPFNVQGEREHTVTVRRTRRMTRNSEEVRSIDSDQATDISHSDSEDEYVPPSLKNVRAKEPQKSSDEQESSMYFKLPKKRRLVSLHSIHIPNVDKSNKKQMSKPLKIKFSRLKSKASRNMKTDFVECKNEISPPLLKTVSKTAETILKTDIPSHLCKLSKIKLKDLAQEAKKYIDGNSTIENVMRMLIKCSVNGCDHVYPLWLHMAVHLKYYHYDGASSSEDDVTQKLSMLADNGELDYEIYQFKCKHTDCSLSFTTEENLQEHESVHGTELVLICGFPDCTKAFKTARSLHVHFRSHTGERPFLCTEPGCEKSFKDSKELSKHKSRHVGEKPHRCVSDGCGKAFFTISELNSHKSTHMKSDSLCCDVCGKQYANEKGLIRHKRRVHGIGKPGRHRCPYEDCEESFVKKEKLEIHMCTHSPEMRLFCEKCGKKFSCQRYLDVHYKIHMKNEKHAMDPPARSIQCEFSGCGKMFTTRENMKSHVLNQHRGRKPRAVPGVFFPCMVEDCGKKFSFRSTLYRHNKLVHKGGDYKLGREVVKYICKYEACAKEFNRKNLLEEHMVMEHGKTPKRLLPLQNKELDFIERICVHCGMALTVALLPRHEEVYHSDKAIREMKENSPYPCHLKTCQQVFNTREDRKSHVQEHIDNPPYRCQVGDCNMTFFLEKNLDNHLWNHSKKVSTCDYEGCSRTFDDQLQLAKHSKFHYDGKMKCPWPNCDNWLTETGHLKPHFIAHSRSLRANLDYDFVCEVCELAFNSNWGLMIHKRMHGEEAAAKPSLSRLIRFVCEEDGCQATFADQKGFFDHFLFHYTNTPASCDFDGCTQHFRNMITMSRHTKCHYNGKFKCPWHGCAKLFASVFILKKHLYRHILSNHAIASNRVYSCSQCFMIFKLEGNHLSHQEHHNEKSDYVCPICGKNGRHNHMKVHRLGNKPRKCQECQQCGARYATISGLKFHLLQKHKIGKWPFKCNYCGKGFVSSREMQRHIPSHTKEKPFSCEICGASFASHTGHRAHMRKHTGEKYVCDIEGCGKMYTTPISLRGHKAKHAGFSKTCNYCFKTYKNPYGHKCKASRDSKLKQAKQEQSQVLRPPVSILAPVLSHPALPPHSQPSVSSIASSMLPATTSMQHAVIIPQQVVTHTMDVQQVTRAIMAPSALTHTHIMPHSLPQGIPHGLSQGMPQVLQHGLTNQGMIQDGVQPGPMDMTRGASMDVTGDYTFNNYVVFWDSHNVS